MLIGSQRLCNTSERLNVYTTSVELTEFGEGLRFVYERCPFPTKFSYDEELSFNFECSRLLLFLFHSYFNTMGSTYMRFDVYHYIMFTLKM